MRRLNSNGYRLRWTQCVSRHIKKHGEGSLTEEEFAKMMLDVGATDDLVTGQELTDLWMKWVGTGNQKAFDFGAHHMRTDKRVSENTGATLPRPNFWGEEGIKSVIAAMILDEHRNSALDLGHYKACAHMVFQAVIKSGLVGHPGALFLNDLQMVYDLTARVEWPIKMRALAAHWGLDDSALNGWVENEV